ncbi:DoxX family protein [Chitinophaga sp. G-6-1-13]|uniref:DoxX family protein n=1 Tax=Chitinophaga fulva TaxID=2728842 RepID=A0A848GQV2_9BACT|nr:DoxX family protein [Chitinophaga fulva]NML40357.1 DoxX family protein [Chitinophaga fulva]
MYKDFTQWALSTDDNWTGLVLRLTLGLVLFPHVAQKLFGWFDGPGLRGEMHYMTTKAGLPAFVAITAITIECLGAFLLLAGAGTRFAAVAVFCLFMGMILVVHSSNGFFMNWFGKVPSGTEGFEYHLLVLGICIAIMIQGGGKYSIDKLLNGYSHNL